MEMDAEVQTTLIDKRSRTQNDPTVMTLGFPRKKLSSSSDVHKMYRRAILEASAELSHDFHTKYLDEIVKGNLGKVILDVQHPSTSYETLKKGFLFYLNGTGKYLIIREHLRKAVFALLEQKALTSHVHGFKTRQQYQEFLHSSYSYMLDTMNEALNSTTVDESLGNGITKCEHMSKDNQNESSRKVRHLRDLLLYAQEALAQSDFENAHRLHIERVVRSEDSDECWIDFAIMWISRGDVRLAQIAVREALTKNPSNLIGLLLAGLIAGNDLDERGLFYLETLLQYRQVCPEIHVLLAMVHSVMGHKEKAELYYEIARRIHHTLTKPILEINIPQNVKENSEDEKVIKKKEKKKKRDKKGESSDEGSKEKKKRGKSKDKAKKAKSPKTAPSPRNTKKSRLGRKGGSKKKTSPAKEKSDSHEIAGIDTASDSWTDLGSKITKADIGATKPPSLGSCLIVTWNVTKKRNPKLVTSDPVFGHDNKDHAFDGSETFEDFETRTPFQSLVSSDGENEEWEETVIQEGHRERKHHRRHRHHKKLLVTGESIVSGNHWRNVYDNLFGLKVKSEELPGEEDPNELQSEEEDSLLQESPPSNHTNTAKHSSFVAIDSAGNINESETQVHSQRFGSEFLWTAHLLLKLRQFEFLDLIMAAEISKTSRRSIEYLYIRAMSLHLRGRDEEALEVIQEAFYIDPENGILWTLQGHAYFKLKEIDAAMSSYQRAMMLPHGRESLHLLYLRYGTLCIEKGDFQLAKRILLKGVALSPSPYLWIAIGNTSYSLGELEESLNAFAEANKLDNTNPEIWAYLSKVSLAQGNRTLAEQSYKWAIRFGLREGKLMDDIKDLQEKRGYGDPAFPKIPNCIPHEVFMQRLGRETPLQLYAEALNFSHLHKKQRNEFENRESEEDLIRQLNEKDLERVQSILNKEEEEYEEEEEEEEELEPDKLFPKKTSRVSSFVKKNGSVPSLKVNRRSINTWKKRRGSKSSIKEQRDTKRSLGSK